MGAKLVAIYLDVFGRELLVRRKHQSWEACYVGNEGKIRPADDIQLPADLAADSIPQYIADLCHEWATPAHSTVTVLRSKTNGTA